MTSSSVRFLTYLAVSSSVVIVQPVTLVTKSDLSLRAGYNVSKILDTLLERYDKRLRPGFRETPTQVSVNMNIRSMGPVSESDMSYQMDCYFRQAWVDKRLQFDGPKTLPVNIQVLNRLWKPDTHFINGRQSYLHTVTSPNKLLRISGDGSILYSMRLTIKASCPMHLQNFPLDTQTCPLKIGSHGYSTDDVIYSWTPSEKSPIQTAADMTLSQFDLIGYPHSDENVTRLNGEFSQMSVQFTLRRHMGFFLINVYVPCSLLVICSWVGFWINREATSDRIALGVTTVLTMAFLTIDNRRDLPEVSYSTALDYFLGTCFSMVLATILQFASVHYFTKHGSGETELYMESDSEEVEKDVRKAGAHAHAKKIYTISRKPESGSTEQHGDDTIYPLENGLLSTHARSRRSHGRLRGRVMTDSFCYKLWNCLQGNQRYRDKQRRKTRCHDKERVNSVSEIDRCARIVFPLGFIVFNVFYWRTYLHGDTTNIPA